MVGRLGLWIDQAAPGVDEVLRLHARTIRPIGGRAQFERVSHGAVVIWLLFILSCHAIVRYGAAGTVIAQAQQVFIEQVKHSLLCALRIHRRVKRRDPRTDGSAQFQRRLLLFLARAAGQNAQHHQHGQQQTEQSFCLLHSNLLPQRIGSFNHNGEYYTK